MAKIAKQQIKSESLPPIPETLPEKVRPLEKEQLPALKKETPAPSPAQPDFKKPISVSPPEPSLTKDPQLAKIEVILSEGLTDLYKNMPEADQKQFKQKGEEVASKIKLLTQAVKIQANKILELIKSWLRLIPHVNKFFLEQEAKIKTDKILIMAEEEKLTNNK